LNKFQFVAREADGAFHLGPLNVWKKGALVSGWSAFCPLR
jgi:hypothetical protein